MHTRARLAALRRSTATTALASGSAVGIGLSPVVPTRAFHGLMDPIKERRLKHSSMAINKPRGRDMASDMFEQRIYLVTTDAHSAIYDGATARTCVVDLVDVADVDENLIQHPSTVPHFTELGITRYAQRAQKNMRRNSDSWAATYVSGKCSVIHLVDPVVNHKMYRREEAQVELIAAYRNALFEFHDLNQASAGVDSLRIPALSLYTSDRFQDDIGKLNQQALLKGFHRTPGYVKDWFAANPQVRVELYVPGYFIDQFQKAFSEEPWLPLQSTVDPGRARSLYSGMPVPRQMLDNPGWVGKRQELLDAPATDGESIESVRQIDPSMLRKARESYRLPRSSGAAPVPRAVDEAGNLVEMSTDFTPNEEIQRKVAEQEAQRKARERPEIYQPVDTSADTR